HLRGEHHAWSKTASATGSAWSVRSTATARTSRPALRRHRRFVVDLRGSNHQRTFFALAGNDDLAVLAAFERGFETVEPQAAFGPFFAVASKARSFEHGANVFGV